MLKKEFIEKIGIIQKRLVVQKKQRNTFGNYSYRSCEDILEEVKKHIGELTLLIDDEIVMVGERYYIKATVTITDGEHLVKVASFARESLDKKGMDSAQITGAASSYARKYALNGLFMIDDTKDPDTYIGKRETQKKNLYSAKSEVELRSMWSSLTAVEKKTLKESKDLVKKRLMKKNEDKKV